MGSSLHSLADSEELDLGAFLYCVSRLPEAIAGARLVVMGQSAEALVAGGLDVERLAGGGGAGTAAALVRRRLDGTLAVLLASASDVDDLVPDAGRLPDRVEQDPRCALRRRRNASSGDDPDAETCAARARRQRRGLAAAAGVVGHGVRRPARADPRRPPVDLRVRMLGGTQHRLRADDAALVGAGPGRARARASVTATLLARWPVAAARGLSTSSLPTRTAWSTSPPAWRASASRSWSTSSRRCPPTTSCARS